MRWIFYFLLLVLNCNLAASAATHYVYADGTGDYPTIQDCIYTDLNDGDVILLGDGIFAGVGNRDLDTNETQFTIQSISGDPTLCIIDCEGSLADPHFSFY